MFTKNKKDKNNYHWKPGNMKYLHNVRIIVIKSVWKYHPVRRSHHIEASQSIYNVDEISVW